MTAEVAARHPLVERVLSGQSPELERLAAQGLLPLPPEELIPLQVWLTGRADALVADQARMALTSYEPAVMADFLAHAAGEDALSYFIEWAQHPLVLETLLRRRDLAPRLLKLLAPRLSPDLQEILLLRQDAILIEPSILLALEQNPQVSTYSLRRIGELREHLLPPSAIEGAPSAALSPETDGEVIEASDEGTAAAIVAVRRLPAAGDVDELTGLSEAQIRALPPGVRIRLCRSSSRTLRGILIRDQNPVVAIAALGHGQLTEQEVEHVARSRAVVEEVLNAIAASREWSRRYMVVQALVSNPRTPISSALRLVPQLAVRDLRNLARDRNVPDAVRGTAQRLYRIKAK